MDHETVMKNLERTFEVVLTELRTQNAVMKAGMSPTRENILAAEKAIADWKNLYPH